jgi:hypothetical protein
MKYFPFLISFFLSSIKIDGQVPLLRSLIVAQFRQDTDGTGRYTYLMSYNFKNEILISKDTLYGIDTYSKNSSKNYARFDLGENILYKNRYVITSVGDIIDLKNKSYIGKSSMLIFSMIGDSILCNEGWGFEEQKGFTFFNLKTNKYSKIKDGSFYTKCGLLSPDNKHSLQNRIREKMANNETIIYNDRIVLSRINEESRTVVNHCCATMTDNYTQGWPEIAMIWIDNENFVFADYCYIEQEKIDKKSMPSVAIYKMNITTGKRDTLGIIHTTVRERSNADFVKTTDNSILFDCSSGYFKIDLLTKKIEPTNYYETGNDFAIQISSKTEGLKIIKHKGVEIGKINCRYYEAKTSNDFIAVEELAKSKVLEFDSYFTKGINVWNAFTKTWTPIEIRGLAAIIGWQEN